jgi:HSP20 family protein
MHEFQLPEETDMNVTTLEPYGLFGLLSRNPASSPHHGVRLANHSDDPVADWVPAVDIVEEKERFVLNADLPGVAPDAIDIHMDKGVLSISGGRENSNDHEENGAHRLERVTGRFARRFSLPETADADNISARCSNGTLEVSIPKLPEVLHRRIAVEAA